MNESKATRYQRLKRRAGVAGIGSAAVVLGVIAFTPAARGIARFAQGLAAGFAPRGEGLFATAVFVILLVVAWELAALPAVLYLARRVDRTYGRASLSVEEVIGAHASATVVALPAALAVGAAVWLATLLAGRWWWLGADVAVALILAAALRGGPVILTWLARVRPVSRPAVAERLALLARGLSLPLAGIDEWMIPAAGTTAVVTGIGRGRRVLVSSDIITHWTDDEIAVVVAHELAHHVHHDLWSAWALDATVLGAAFFLADLAVSVLAPSIGATGPADLAALPLIALVTGGVWLMASPLRHAQSRHQERRADSFALASTGQADAFGTAIRRLSARHMAEEQPSVVTRWLYYRHPSVTERLAAAAAYQRARQRS